MADIPTEATGSPEEREALAAELALGLLEGEERARALRLRMSDATFATMVEAWHARLAQLLLAYGDETPDERVWRGIVERLAQPQSRPAVAGGLRRWRALAISTGAIAVALALFVLVRPAPEPIPPHPHVAIAQLIGETDGLRVVARYDEARARLSLRSEGIAPSAKSPELWVIPADGKPRSLGLIARAGASDIGVPQPLRPFLSEGAVLAVTMENPATAPHPAPTSPPVALGPISII